jgi:DNA-binding MurR/RpiR family transcriptional regulator
MVHMKDIEARKKSGGPSSYERLINEITHRHDEFGSRAQDIARYIVQNPNQIALDSTKTLADRLGVRSSNLVRFAQGLGYSGFSEMQRVFQSRLVAEAPGFSERLQALRSELMGRQIDPKSKLLHEVVVNDIAALHQLRESIQEETLVDAAHLLSAAQTIFLAGNLRSFPVAAYLHYAFLHLRRPAQLITGAGGLASELAQLAKPNDVLIATSFRFYSREVVDLVEDRASHGVPIIAITDSHLSPLVKHARISIIVPAGEHNFSASLAAPMCAAQALVMAMANELGDEAEEGRERGAPNNL